MRKTTGIKVEEIKIILKLYRIQTVKVRFEQINSEDIWIRNGFRQGYIISRLLFNIYSEAILREVLDGIKGGIKINGAMTNTIRYAKDTVVFTANIDDFQQVINSIVEHSENYGLTLNTFKTKPLVFSKILLSAQLKMKGESGEQVFSLKYLGTIFNEQTI